MSASLPRVVVIGLGRFGKTLAQTLAEAGAEVIAIDNNPKRVDETKDVVSTAVVLDSTDMNALASQELGECDVAVVAIGEQFEAALLTSVILKKLGIPRLFCRAQTPIYAEIYRQIGADEVIQPETRAGAALARTLASPHIQEVVPLGEGYSLIELRAPRPFLGKTLKGLSLRMEYGVNLVVIKREETVTVDGREEVREVITVPVAEDRIHKGDTLVLIGENEDLNKLPKE